MRRNDLAVPEVEKLGAAAPGYLAYQASKVKAEYAFWQYQNEKPSFDMISLCPA